MFFGFCLCLFLLNIRLKALHFDLDEILNFFMKSHLRKCNLDLWVGVIQRYTWLIARRWICGFVGYMKAIRGSFSHWGFSSLEFFFTHSVFHICDISGFWMYWVYVSKFGVRFTMINHFWVMRENIEEISLYRIFLANFNGPKQYLFVDAQ